MKPEDFQKIQEMLDGVGGVEPWLVIVIAAIGLAAGYFGSYLKEKGKNTATKEDIAEVTSTTMHKYLAADQAFKTLP